MRPGPPNLPPLHTPLLASLLALLPSAGTPAATLSTVPAVVRPAASDPARSPAHDARTMLFSEGSRVLVATWERPGAGRTRVHFSSRGDALEIALRRDDSSGLTAVTYVLPDGVRLEFLAGADGSLLAGDAGDLQTALAAPTEFLGLVRTFLASESARTRWTGVAVEIQSATGIEGTSGFFRCVDECAAGCPAQCALECNLGLLDPFGLLCDVCKTSCVTGCGWGCRQQWPETRF